MDNILSIIGVIAFIWCFVAMINSSQGSMRGCRRMKTDREDALHDQIQQAMNWKTGFPYECEDGKWRDCYGKEYEVMSLEEAMKKYVKDPGPGKRIKK